MCSTLCNPVDLVCQAPLSLGFSRQEYWSWLPFSRGSRDRTCISYVSCTDKQVLYHYCHLGSPLQANVYSDFWISVAKNIIGLEIHVFSCCILISITIFFSISLLLYSIFGKSILFKFFLSLFLTKKKINLYFSPKRYQN